MKLLFEVFLAAAALFVAWRADFYWFATAVFFFIALALYFSQPSEERPLTRTSLLFLLLATLFFLGSVRELAPPTKDFVAGFAATGAGFAAAPSLFLGSAAIIAFAVLLYLFLGLGHGAFERRDRVYAFCNSSVLLLVLLFLGFVVERGGIWLREAMALQLAAVFFATALLTREFFRFRASFSGGASLWITSALFSLVSAEFWWIFSFLPLSSLQCAFFLWFYLVLFRTAIISLPGAEGLVPRKVEGLVPIRQLADEGPLRGRFYLKIWTLFALGTLLLLLTAVWSI